MFNYQYFDFTQYTNQLNSTQLNFAITNYHIQTFNMKYTTQIFGNYMCKDPPCIIINPQSKNCSKIIFNTPSHIMRGLSANNYKLNFMQTVMFTKHSTDTLNGFVYFVTNFSDVSIRLRNLFPSFKIYGNLQTFFYLETAKYHLGAKSLSLSYTAWGADKWTHKIGVNKPALLKTIVKSKQSAQYVGKINKKLGQQKPQNLLDARLNLNQNFTIYSDDQFEIRPIFQVSPRILKSNNELLQNSTHFMCYFKKETSQNISANYCAGILIVTYRNLQQIKKILQKQDYLIQFNQKGLLNSLQQSSKIKIKKQGQQFEAQGIIKQVIHLIDDHNLINTVQFHLLFNKINDILVLKKQSVHKNDYNLSQTLLKINHLFYGYGIKMENTSYYELSEMYLKSNVFYTIMAKHFRFFPNIFDIHTSYWKLKFMSFSLLEKQKLQLNNKQNVDLCFYRPGHELKYSSNIFSSVYSQANGINLAQKIQNMEGQQKKLREVMPYKIKSYDIKLDKPTKMNQKFKQFDPKIVFLGTKSKYPSHLRNTSGILMELNHPKQKQKQTLILLDCGNNSYDQFMLHYSPELVQSKLMSLKIIFITHLHSDHTLGILDLICKRNRLIAQSEKNKSQNKLFLIIPSNMIGWVHYYCQFVQDLTKQCMILFSQELANQQITVHDKFYETHKQKGSLFKKKFASALSSKLFNGKGEVKNQKQVVQNQNQEQQVFSNKQISDLGQTCVQMQIDVEYYQSTDTDKNQQQTGRVGQLLKKYKNNQKTIKSEFEQFLSQYGIKKFLPTRVFHCPMSYGIIIQHQSAIKISYSGDCRPTQQFMKEAQKSSLMIHEATYSSSNLDDAKKFAHTTFKQAIQTGLNSKSQKLCLTHFKTDIFNIEGTQVLNSKHFSSSLLNYYLKNGIIGCDHLQFRLSDMNQVGQVSRLVGYLGQQFIKNTKNQ